MRRLLPISLLLIPWVVAATPARPNIILIVADDQRADTIRALGNESIITPNLDALADGGFVSTGARIQGSDQGAVCVASRSMLWSGNSLWNKNDNLTGKVTLGEALRANGYQTYGTGKWHNGDPSLVRTFVRANNITSGFLSSGHSVAFKTTFVQGGGITRGANVPSTHSSDLIGSTAVNFIGEHSGADPFFLYVGFNAPHDPFNAVTSYLTPYKTEGGDFKIPLPVNFLPQSSFDHGSEIHNIRDEVLLPRPLQTNALLQQNTNYYAMISQVDHWVGKIVEQLRDRGLDENTIIIFTSDHGLARGSHGLLGKQNLYEHSLKVPLVIHGAGVPAGKKSAAPVYLSELYPTILDYAETDLPAKQVQGLSIRPIIESKVETHRRVTYHAYTGGLRGVVDGPLKLIEYRNSSGRFTQLFDVVADPAELVDLSSEPARANEVARLRKLLWQEKLRFKDENSAFWSGSDLVPPGEEEVTGNAAIEWQPAVNTTGIGNLIGGNAVYAVTGSASPVTVNGITFTPYDLGLGFLEDVYSPVILQTTGDAAFDQLIDSFTYGGGAGATLNVIRGLKPGEKYSIQVFYNDQRPSFGARTMTFRDSAGNTARVSAGRAAGTQADDYGQYATGTFVAEEDTQALYITPDGFGNSHVNAILVTGPPGDPVIPPTDPDTGTALDSDLDGHPDFTEEIAGTDPYDPVSRPTSVLQLHDGSAWLGWTGIPDRSYRIEASESLGRWEPLPNVLKGNGRWQTISEEIGLRKFYRISATED